MIFDTHAHINYFKDPLYSPDLAVKEALTAGVDKILLPGVEPSKFDEVIEYIEKYDCIYGALGVHPSEADKFNNDVAKKISELSRHPKIVALGEIGLDYYHGKDNIEQQKHAFEIQLEIATALGLPVLIHDRDAHRDTLEILSKYNVKKAIMHCFSGSVEFAKECTKKGFLLGIGGVVTFKNARNIKEVVKEIPLTSIVLETDAPYLAPHPFRGSENSPKYLPFIAKEIANIKDIALSEVEKITTKNALEFFNIEE